MFAQLSNTSGCSLEQIGCLCPAINPTKPFMAPALPNCSVEDSLGNLILFSWHFIALNLLTEFNLSITEHIVHPMRVLHTKQSYPELRTYRSYLGSRCDIHNHAYGDTQAATICSVLVGWCNDYYRLCESKSYLWWSNVDILNSRCWPSEPPLLAFRVKLP